MCEYGFAEGIDFNPLKNEQVQIEGTREVTRTITDHQLTIEMAKELCMLQRTEKGKQARQYFIELERYWNSPEAVMARAIKMAEKKILSLQSTVAEMLPKAEGYDNLMNATGTVTIAEAAAIIGIKGIGQNKFFNLLWTEEIIRRTGNSYIPRSEFKDHFVVKQHPIKKGDMLENRSQLYLDMSGLDWLAKILSKRGYEVRKVISKSA
jgi:anti-repressor protein